MPSLKRLTHPLVCLGLAFTMMVGCSSDAPPAPAAAADVPVASEPVVSDVESAAEVDPAPAKTQEPNVVTVASAEPQESAMDEAPPREADDTPAAMDDTNQDTAAETPADVPATSPAAPPQAPNPDAVPVLPLEQAAAQDGRLFEGVMLNREAGCVDLDAVVCGRQVDWLELLACSPNSREHESIVTIDAKASHIQLALLLLGLEPGSPVRVERPDDGELIVHPPTGPRVGVYFILPDDPETLIPANAWVKSQENGQPLPDNQWLFTGSRFVDYEGERWFLADENGTVISLVNFGDELLGRDTLQGDDGGNGLWTTIADEIPQRGTKLTVRLIPVNDNPDAAQP